MFLNCIGFSHLSPAQESVMSCSKIRRKNDNSCFISQLPISIIHHILSLLPIKDCAKTCVLSKTWNNFYASRHIMVFHESDFKEGIEGKKLFMNYIDKSLNRRMQMTSSNDPFERFELHMKCDPDDESQPGHVNDWLQKVFGIGVKTMSLLLLHGDKLCGLVFDSQTLVELHVHCLFFMRACSIISLPNLKVLTLSCVSLNDESLKNLISGCPMVEVLCLSQCDTSRKLQFSGLARLVKLELSYCKDVEMVEICSPYFEIFSSFSGDGPSTIELIGSYERVKKLELNAWLSTKFSAFRFLEQLNLESLYIRGRISSQSLKRLVIKSCGAETEMVEIDCPNLMCLQYENNHKPFSFVSACNPIDFRYESSLLQSKRSVQMNALENLFRSTFGATRNLNVLISLSPRKVNLFSFFYQI